MRSPVLDLIHCPQCHQSLLITPAPDSPTEEIWQGMLTCTQCRACYPIHNGIPHLFVDDASWASKAREAQGWLEFHQEQGIYEFTDPNDFKLPYTPDEPWRTFAANFDLALEQLKPNGHEVVLDLGAGRGWAAKHFALRGCQALAIDILDDPNIGLGRAWDMMAEANTHFTPLIADGERLPLYANSVDIVFCSAALHHSSDMPLLLQNIHRVLKPGGRLCAINEPAISLFEDARSVLARDAKRELELGINENRPTLLDYYSILWQLGFDDFKSWTLVTQSMSVPQLLDWAKELGAVQPDISPARPQQTLIRWGRFMRNRLRTLRYRRSVRALLKTTEPREQLTRLTSLYVTGGISFIAHKVT